MTIKIALALSNNVLSEGINSLLEDEEDLSVLGSHEPECTLETMESLAPDVIIIDFPTLYNSLPDLNRVEKRFHVLLIDTNCGRENIVSAILNKKLSGVLVSNTDSSMLKRAIRAVAAGEIWIDNVTFKNLLTGINSFSNENNSILSEREKGIIGLICKGYKNREIAQKLNVSEPTVKAHLTRMFLKLKIRTRSELITFAVKNNQMNN
ncbi:MAG: response regulator transcription factor [Deltaproteobacteria bacterium]|nr:response regulator transcription factor [Deltaproteobacteria bacterium]